MVQDLKCNPESFKGNQILFIHSGEIIHMEKSMLKTCMLVPVPYHTAIILKWSKEIMKTKLELKVMI